MAMYFRFHIYARKSQNYPGSGLGFGNNFCAHNWHYQQKILFVFYWWCNKTKQQKTKTKNQIKKERDTNYEKETHAKPD